MRTTRWSAHGVRWVDAGTVGVAYRPARALISVVADTKVRRAARGIRLADPARSRLATPEGLACGASLRGIARIGPSDAIDDGVRIRPTGAP